VVIWDLKMAARQHCPKALQRIAECLDDEDKKVRLMAAQIMLERGYGKAEQHVDSEVTHNFCIAPDVMPLDAWLERKGQPVGAAGDEWLAQQRSLPGPAATERRTSEPPAGVGHASGPPVIDLQAEDPMLLDQDPTAPPPAGAKLN
jgi:hypothetical protein